MKQHDQMSFFTLLFSPSTKLIFLILTSFILFKWLTKQRNSNINKQKRTPPCPPKLPILGNIHQVGKLPHRSLKYLAETYGRDLMMLYVGSIPVLVVSSVDMTREILKNHDLSFSNRPKIKIAKKLLYDYKDVAFSPYGEYWRKMKSLCVLQLLSNKRVHSFHKVRDEEVKIMIDDITKTSVFPSSPLINLSERFALLSNNVACRVVMGRKFDEGSKFKDLLAELARVFGGFDVGDYIPWLGWINLLTGFDKKVDKLALELDGFLNGVVEEHIERRLRNGGEEEEEVGEETHQDFVDILLSIQKESSSLGFTMDKTSIKAILLDMFTGGTDTIHTTLEWAMAELLRNPKIMKNVQEEVRKIAEDKALVTEDKLDKMPYLKAVIKETLRLHPPLPLLLPRESTQDVKLNNYTIKSGTQVLINVWAIGRDPVSWEKPEDFYPQRFLNSSTDFRGHHFEFIPFGGGRRGCPGIAFAIAILELSLANILHKFDRELPQEGNGYDMTESTGITTHKKFPLLGRATPRFV